jgi:hypothetical protein
MVEKQRLVRRAFWAALILLVAVLFAFSESEQGWAQHGPTIISPEDLDRAYVRSDTPNENYGGGNLHAKYELKVERSFIKYDFDVGDEDTGSINLGDGETVILHLDAKNIDGVALVGVYSVSSNWEEDSITWANAPDSFWVCYGTVSGSGDVDVTDAVDDEGILNLGLKIDVESGYKEYVEWDNAYLTIETDGGQVPFEDLERAYVRSDTPNGNYGGENLHAKYELKVERSFVKYDFDVGDENTGNIRLGDGDTVILHLDAETTDGVALVGVYGVSSNWEEDNITWANAPDSFWVCYGTLSGSGDVDVTDAVDDEGILSLGLKIDVESGYTKGCIEWDNAYLYGDYSPAADVVTRAYTMITSPQDGLFTEESKRIVTYELLGENLSQATFFHNGEETDISPESGSITITLIPGENVFEVRTTNDAGSTASSEQVTVMFLPRMEATITYPPAMGFAGSGGTLLTVSSVEVKGIVVSYPAVTEVTIILNDKHTMITNVDNGYFEYTITTLEEGLNTIRAKVANIWGDTASSGIVGVIYAPEKLTVEVSSPQDGGMTNAKICVVSGTITHGRALTQAILYLDGVGTPIELTREGSSYTYPFSKEITLREGENTFAVEGTDEIGDSGSSGTMFITLDTTPPQVEITTPANNYLTNTTTVSVTGTVDDPAVSEVSVGVSGNEQTITVIKGIFSGEVVLIEGTNTIVALALDPLGNEGSSQTVNVTYNSAAPTVSITSPSGGTRTNSDTVTINYTISGNATSAQFILNGVSEGIPLETGSTTVSLAEGENTIEVQVSNQTITASSGVVTVVSDTTAPSMSADVSEPWEEIDITVCSDEQLSSPPTVTVTGTDTIEVDMALTGVREWIGTYKIPGDGDYLVEVQGTDVAGNAGSCTSSFTRQKESVSAFAGETITVESNRLTVDIEVDEEVKDQSISTVLRYEDPGLGEVITPAIFVRVMTGVPLRWAMTAMTVKAIYDPTKLPADISESSLLLYLWTPSKGGYVPIQGAIVDTVTHSITGTVRY